VQLNGVVFATSTRVPDESTVPDDVVMELSPGNTELEFTRRELRRLPHTSAREPTA
jgi:hypothetical protein